jgi:hypothetical protein
MRGLSGLLFLKFREFAMLIQYIVEHEGKRIIVDPPDCNPVHFRSAIRFIRSIKIDPKILCDRIKRRNDRCVAEKSRRGTPIKWRLEKIRNGGDYEFWM